MEVVPPPLHLQVVLPPPEVPEPRRHQRRRQRKKVSCFAQPWICQDDILTVGDTEKEESDEDMGFGLFD